MQDPNMVAFYNGAMKVLEKKAQSYAAPPEIESHLADTSVVSGAEAPAVVAPEKPQEQKQQEFQDVELSPDEFYQLMHMLQYYQ
jgi:hypothetical protein